MLQPFFYLIEPELQSHPDALETTRGSLNIFIIHNPVSGTSDPASVRPAIEAHCAAHAVEFEIYETKPGDPIPEIVREAAGRGFARIAAAGGDGTISAAANGLLGSRIPLGILPLGSGNAFAREMEIPLKLEDALAVLTASRAETVIDTLLVGERNFLMNVSVGLSAATMAATEREQKRRMGKIAYLLQGLAELRGSRRSRITVQIDERRVRTRASEIVVANTGLVGYKSVRLSPDIRPDDGRMHVCIVRSATLGSYLRLLGYALGGDPTRLPEMNCFPGEVEIRIESEDPLPVQADGEVIGETPVAVGIAPRSLRVLIPEGRV